jgi:hypothetical protein
MIAMGSEPEGQEFFRTEAKPPCRSWDRAKALLMTDDGWGRRMSDLLSSARKLAVQFAI